MFDRLSWKRLQILKPKICFFDLPFAHPFCGAKRHDLYGIVLSQGLESLEARDAIRCENWFQATDFHAGTVPHVRTKISRQGHKPESHSTYCFWRGSLLQKREHDGQAVFKFVLINRYILEELGGRLLDNEGQRTI